MTPNNAVIIGLTGNSGSGKSTVAKIMAEYGAYVLDADALSHEAMSPSGSAYDEIVREFGFQVLNSDKTVNRSALGDLVFRNATLKKKLESIIHARVIEKTVSETLKAKSLPNPPEFVIWDAPLLVEASMHIKCDAVWLVVSGEEDKLKRITARDGIDAGKARLRLQNQTDEETLRRHADEVIINDGDMGKLRENVDALVRKLRRR